MAKAKSRVAATGRQHSSLNTDCSENASLSSQNSTGAASGSTAQPNDNGAAFSAPHDFQREPHGLFILYPRPDAGESQESSAVEYVPK
jgi:hypothetical protein